ncbi:hypothetical protein [Helicobacter pylori]|uniref:hypothetical protein n=1 Tax=Helicobacter pylori TaxID=210 RepID=UPI001680E09F|nr:hypothetical protein [Helicobacter pylori]
MHSIGLPIANYKTLANFVGIGLLIGWIVSSLSNSLEHSPSRRAVKEFSELGQALEP